MTDRYNVLLVEDNEVDRMAFERFVRTENLPYRYVIAASIADARKLLRTESFDVALMDYALDDGTTIALFRDAQHLPIIMITGSGDLKLAVEVMKAGAYDYLAKDNDGTYLAALPITVKNAIERWNAQQDVIHYRAHLEKVVKERTAAWIESQIRLEQIVSSTPTVIYSLDRDAQFTFIAGNSQKILGYGPDSLVGKSMFMLFPEQDQAMARAYFQEALTGHSVTSDVALNGRWLSISASAREEERLITGVIGVVYDITERKQAELEMIQERNLLRTLIDNIPDYIFIKDRAGRFIETNRAHAAGANLTPEQILNRTAGEVFDQSVAEQFHRDDEYVMSSGNSIINEERLTTSADGSKRWVLTTKIPLYDDSRHAIIGLVGISRDITDRRNAERERLEAAQLLAETENIRALVDMKQQFIATASHDFRTPLTIISMCATTMTDYSDRLSSEKRLEKLNQIQVQVSRMTRLLDDVLEISKADADKLDFSPIRIQLKPFCERLWNEIIEVDKQDHQRQFAYTTSLSQITADTHLLQYALLNLLSNAFKYTLAGGTIRFEVSSDDQAVIFQVIYTGYGIPAAEQKHLFEPFFRASNVKTMDGTGLGLAIIKAYVERHNGTITVQSQEGIGTTFTVRLPV